MRSELGSRRSRFNFHSLQANRIKYRYITGIDGIVQSRRNSKIPTLCLNKCYDYTYGVIIHSKTSEMFNKKLPKASRSLVSSVGLTDYQDLKELV